MGQPEQIAALLSREAPLLMGIVNVTPDSFSDGGRYMQMEAAVDHAHRLIAEGADIIDIGGESTRPGATPVSVQTELDRVMPVVERLRDCGVPLSIDTRHAAVMREAIESGVGMINDVTALRGDAESVNVIAGSDVFVCLMHMLGDPRTMQVSPEYRNVVTEVHDFLKARLEACRVRRVRADRIIADPGIGFGKAPEDNFSLMRSVSYFKSLDVPLLIGVSRKSFISHVCPDASALQREPGSIAAALWCLTQGVRIFRVHDVAATRQAFDVYKAIGGVL